MKMNHRNGILKKCLSFLLPLMMLLTLTAAPAAAGAEDAAELWVGSPTRMSGNFFTEMFGNNSADIDVRALIHGYNVIRWDGKQSVFVVDTSVVRDTMFLDNDAGDRTYYLILQDDLYYSDGSPVTSWDYAFSLLLMMSPEIEGIGGKIYRAEHILGSDDYITGRTEYLAGVKILSDHQLAITLDHNFLPYFQEQGLLLCVPYPISVIAPGCAVYDDGNGVYIGNADKSAGERLFTPELLKKTILDPETGYNSHPSVTSGPYKLDSFDGETAHFSLNPYFKGTMDGIKPTIQRIAYTWVSSDDAADKLKSGEIHLYNKAVYGKTIKACRSAGMKEEKYGRDGLTFLTFSCEKPAVHEMEVRQAIAWCLDRDALTTEYCGESGKRVDGYFGTGQWEYQLVKQEINHPAQMDDPSDLHREGDQKVTNEAWKTLTLDNLTAYHVDTIKANALLDKAGWTLNAEGGAYDGSKGGVRCKEIDGEIVPLELKMIYPEGSHIFDNLKKHFTTSLGRCGIVLEAEAVPMNDLLREYYRETERTADMIYLGTNFHVMTDPSVELSLDGSVNHERWNSTYSDDEDLYWRAVNMRQTDPQDVYDYVTKWVAFQERYNEVLPAIPVYSNMYSDFWRPELTGYTLANHNTWTQAILKAAFAK